MGLSRHIAERPLLAAVFFEALLIPVALALGLLLGVDPAGALRPSRGVLLGGLLATLPLVAALLGLGRLRPDWFEAVERLVQPLIDTLFRGRGAGPVLLVAALAGLGEELLFRGVLQAALVEVLGPVAALVVAALVFGLVHALSWAYFAMASLMGLYLGALFLLTGNLLLPVIVHAVYDAIAIAILLGRPPPAHGEASSSADAPPGPQG